jgi:SAM-dependent methyltransferase
MPACARKIFCEITRIVMKYIIRDKSIITNKKNLRHLYTLKKFPAYIGVTAKKREKDILADMAFYICPESGIIQLKKLLPPKIIYSGYHSEAIGGIWDEHHHKFADFIRKFQPQKVLEIGGSNAFLANLYLKRKKQTQWNIIEPNPSKNISKDKRIKITPSMFKRNIFKEEKKFDAVVHSHVWEHMYDPVKFLRDAASYLNEGGLHIFTVPNLYEYMKNKFVNCLNFEHTVFLTEQIIDYLLVREGFEIIEKKYFLQHSIFYATRKNAKLKKKAKFKSLYKEYSKLFQDYIQYYRKEIRKINSRIKNEEKVYLFGAHVFSQFLLNFGLEKGKIGLILDNSKIKQGQRLYGTSLFVAAPEKIHAGRKPVVIVKAGAYQEEIKKQLFSINNGVKVIE